MAVVVVRAERFWDGISERPSGPVEVVVRDDRIVSTGTRVTPPTGASVVELAGQTLLPGFIDCHVHVVDSALATASDSHQALTALSSLHTLLDNGFTTVRDLGCFGSTVTLDLRDAVDQGLVTGPRMLVAPHIISARGGHGDRGDQEREVGAVADGIDEVVRRVREDVRSGADWIKFAGTGGFFSAHDSPDDVTYSQAEMNALVGAAADLGRHCAVHGFTDEGVRRAVRAGVRSVEHANLASAATLELLAEKGVWLVPTQHVSATSLDNLDDDEFWRGRSPQQREKTRRYADRVRECRRHPAASDVRIAFGTDAGTIPMSDNWREFVTMVDNGISPVRALRAATSEAAALLEKPELGRVAPAAAADLVGLFGDPFEDIKATGRVGFVMKAGIVHRSEQPD